MTDIAISMLICKHDVAVLRYGMVNYTITESPCCSVQLSLAICIALPYNVQYWTRKTPAPLSLRITHPLQVISELQTLLSLC